MHQKMGIEDKKKVSELHTVDMKTESLKKTDDGLIILVPQPSDDPKDPLVCISSI